MRTTRGVSALAKNPVFHDRSKHIDIQYHYTRDLVKERRSNSSTYRRATCWRISSRSHCLAHNNRISLKVLICFNSRYLHSVCSGCVCWRSVRCPERRHPVSGARQYRSVILFRIVIVVFPKVPQCLYPFPLCRGKIRFHLPMDLLGSVCCIRTEPLPCCTRVMEICDASSICQ